MSSKARAVPVISVDKIKPLIENFLLSISLDQSMDLALGQPDGDIISKLKELLLNLVQEYSTFVLYNIRKRRMRSGDVATVVGDSLLKSFAEVFEINGKTHPKSFDCFHELFVKQVKEKMRSSICCMHDPAASFVLQIVAVSTVDSMLPHAIKMMKELLVWKCKDRQTVEQKAIQNPQKEGRKRRCGKSSRKYHHGRYRLLPVIPEEPELEEATEVTEVKVISENQRFEIPGISVDMIQPTENRGLGDRADPLSIAKQKNKGVGDRIRKIFQKYSEGRRNRVAPELLSVIEEELGDKETEVTAVQNFMPEELNLSTEKVINEEKESEVEKSVSEEQIPQVKEQAQEATTEVVELLSLGSGSEKEEQQQSSTILLVNALVMQAVTKSNISCHNKLFQAITKRLSEKIYAEVEGQDFLNIQNRLNKLSINILRMASKNIGCSQKDVLLFLGLNDSNVDEAIVSVCKEEIFKPAKEPNIIKSFLSSDVWEFCAIDGHVRYVDVTLDPFGTGHLYATHVRQGNVNVAQCWNPTSVHPTCWSMSLGGHFVALPYMWGVQFSWLPMLEPDISTPYIPGSDIGNQISVCPTWHNDPGLAFRVIVWHMGAYRCYCGTVLAANICNPHMPANEPRREFCAIAWHVVPTVVIVTSVWNQTSVCPTCQAMRLVGRVVPLVSMWGIQMTVFNIDHHDN
ncbi:hypothetical protein XENOCAPTIV_021706 [Xenoophorus captivus]|uniref:Uncharacterized protein n=1 Tax=Xenoophorus captivus TaxID=1517983 RepID=A0ABV0QC60_9TELE